MADMADILKNFAQNFSSQYSNQNSDWNYNNQDNSQNFNENQNNDFNFGNIDFETMMKISKIISAFQENQNSDNANLLRALKPYLNPSRQKKVDEYIQFLNIEQVLGILNNLGGDSSNDSYN